MIESSAAKSARLGPVIGEREIAVGGRNDVSERQPAWRRIGGILHLELLVHHRAPRQQIGVRRNPADRECRSNPHRSWRGSFNHSKEAMPFRQGHAIGGLCRAGGDGWRNNVPAWVNPCYRRQAKANSPIAATDPFTRPLHFIY